MQCGFAVIKIIFTLYKCTHCIHTHTHSHTHTHTERERERERAFRARCSTAARCSQLIDDDTVTTSSRDYNTLCTPHMTADAQNIVRSRGSGGGLLLSKISAVFSCELCCGAEQRSASATAQKRAKCRCRYIPNSTIAFAQSLIYLFAIAHFNTPSVK